MVRIAIGQEGDFDERSFREHITETCLTHKKEKRALAFAFIVYDFKDNTIQEIIDNRKYWTSLDSISGRFLSVFYIDSNDTYYENRQREIYQEALRKERKDFQPGVMKMMVPIMRRSTPLDKSIEFLKSEFRLDSKLTTPFILFFQVNSDNITDSFVVKLNEEKLENSFLELRSHIQNAVNFITNIQDRYSQNHQEIFDQLKNGVIGAINLEYVKTNVVGKIKIGAIISFIKYLSQG